MASCPRPLEHYNPQLCLCPSCAPGITLITSHSVRLYNDDFCSRASFQESNGELIFGLTTLADSHDDKRENIAIATLIKQDDVSPLW